MSVKLVNATVLAASVAMPICLTELVYVSAVGFDTCNRMTSEWHHHYLDAGHCEYKSRPKDGISKISLSLDAATHTRNGELDSRLFSPSASGAIRKSHVMILGDSFVQADEVPFADHYGSLLRRSLGSSYAVSWHGYSSWSPLLEYKFYKWLIRSKPSLSADTLVFVVFGNDFLPRQIDYSDQYYWYNSSPKQQDDYLLPRDSRFTDVVASEPQKYYLGKGLVTMMQSFWSAASSFGRPPGPANSAIPSSRVPEFGSSQAVEERRKIVAETISQWPNITDSSVYLKSANMLFAPVDQWHKSFLDSAQLSIDSMRAIARDALNNGAKKVVFVYMPYGWEVSSCENYPGYLAYYPRQTFIRDSGIRSFLSTRLSQPEMKAIGSAAASFSFVDSTEFFRAQSTAPSRPGCADGKQANSLFYAFDGHLNSNGHRRFSALLKRVILSQGSST